MHKLIIEPRRTEKNDWRDLWRYREPFFFLAWRDILVRYKQTAISIAWALECGKLPDGVSPEECGESSNTGAMSRCHV
jgi:hypothetical protein